MTPRLEAKARGEKVYSGRLCKLGHTKRYVSNRGCVVCSSEQSMARARVNRETVNRQARERHAAHPEMRKVISRRYYLNHTEEENARSRKFRRDNPKLVAFLCARWFKNNPDKVAHYNGRRRGRMYNATPANADHGIIDALYDIARDITEETGELWTVDHWVPLSKGGLHCHTNLTIMRGSANSSKNARIPDGPCPSIQKTLDALPHVIPDPDTIDMGEG